jgi:hypothetical protein
VKGAGKLDAMRKFASRLGKQTDIAVVYLYLDGAQSVFSRDFRLKLAAACHHRPLLCLLAKLRMPGKNKFLFGTSR